MNVTLQFHDGISGRGRSGANRHARVQNSANRATLERMKSRRPTFLAAAFVGLLLVIGVSTFAVARSARIAQDHVTELSKARM
jgi:hypothetical protein